jgi:hypothetical protein
MPASFTAYLNSTFELKKISWQTDIHHDAAAEKIGNLSQLPFPLTLLQENARQLRGG